ncbi:hypothetical protein ACQPZQ_31955 [Pseudonocardia sp. CA-142604]|uniref:hypothetical protein n=1 Tax=Pseudonocardia sp. CA-142604 TaxID=3240024 RepID=UPI003D8D4037
MRADAVLLVLEDDRGRHTIEHGIGQWTQQCTGVSVWRLHHSYQDAVAAILAGAQWSVPGEDGALADTLCLTWHFLESPFIDQLTLRFDADGVTRRRLLCSAATTAALVVATASAAAQADAEAEPGNRTGPA